jgi:hypothetical protein
MQLVEIPEDKLIYKYDRADDVLYLSFVGEFLPGYGDTLSDSTILRRSIKTDELIGVTIIGLSTGLERGILERDAENPDFPICRSQYINKLNEIYQKEVRRQAF